MDTPFPSDSLSDSSNATVKGEIVIAPTAIERAAVTLELGPYAVVSNGKATAAVFGKPTVSASTEASEMDILKTFSCPDIAGSIQGHKYHSDHHCGFRLFPEHRPGCAADRGKQRTWDGEVHHEHD